jgi:hypothetical protein
MEKHKYERYGDTFILTWPGRGIAFGINRLNESKYGYGLSAYLTVEAITAETRGIAFGPVILALENVKAQREMAETLSERVNGMDRATWLTLVATACSKVSQEWRAGSPTVDLRDTTEEAAPVEFVWDRMVPKGETTILYGDGECVAAGTMIQGPDGDHPVEVLAEQGKPIRVWTLGQDGPGWAWASAPWRKGRAELLRFTLDNGQEITVAGRHRFLTLDGWAFASGVGVGERIAVSVRDRRQTTLDNDQPVSRQDAQRCYETAAGYPGDYWSDSRQCDQPLRPALTCDLAPSPSPGGALAHSRDDWRPGGRASSVARSHETQCGHHASCGSDAVVPMPSAVGFHVAASHAIRHYASSLDQRPSRQEFAAAQPTVEYPRSGIRSSLAPDHVAPKSSLPPLESLTYASVVSITIEGIGDYYDLTVPGTANYLANGVWNHNSAKSLMALMLSVSHTLGLPTPWGPAPAVGRVMYCDWETSGRTVGSRLRRVCAGMGVSVPSILYRQCLRPLHDELPSILEDISRKGITLVVIDSIGFAVTGSLIDDDTARSAISDLRQMECTRLVVGHVSADTAKNPNNKAAPFGSRFFWNGMRQGIELRRSKEGLSGDDDVIDLGMYPRKGNDGRKHREVAIRVAFDGLAGPIVFDEQELIDVPDLAQGQSLPTRLRQLLKRGKASVNDLAEALDEKPEKIRTTLNRMPDAIALEPGGGRNNPGTWGLKALGT